MEKLESDLENFVRLCHLHEKVHNLEQALAEKDHAYQQLMEKAVMFAENITRNGRWQEHEWKDANRFLQSPEVQAWKEHKP